MRALAMLLPLILLYVTPANAGPFADVVAADHWAYDAVDELKGEGVVEGYPDGTYRGNQPVTRYGFVEALARWLRQDRIDSYALALRILHATYGTGEPPPYVPIPSRHTPGA